MKKHMAIIAKQLQISHSQQVILQLWGDDHDLELLNSFKTELVQQGHKVHSLLLTKNVFIKSIKDQTLSISTMYNDCDFNQHLTIIDLYKFPPTGLVQAFSDDERVIFINFMREAFSNFTKKGNDFLQIRIPSHLNALETGMEFESYVNHWKSLIDIDYVKMNIYLDALLSQYTGVNTINLMTSCSQGKEYHLHMSLKERQWYKDNGNGDFPVGEVYIAPIETSSNGQYLASKLFWEDELYKDVLLTFKDGYLIDSSHPRILNDLREAPGDAMILGEFGIGVNPGLNTLTGYSLFDEKLAGTCHIATGMNHLFGGKNESPVHIDFVNNNYKLII